MLKKSVNPQNQAKRSIGEPVLSAFFERSTSPHQGQVLLHRRSSTCIASLQGKTVTPKTIASNPKLQLHIIPPSCTKILGHLGDKPLRPVPTTGSYLAAAATKTSVDRPVKWFQLNSDCLPSLKLTVPWSVVMLATGIAATKLSIQGS